MQYILHYQIVSYSVDIDNRRVANIKEEGSLSHPTLEGLKQEAINLVVHNNYHQKLATPDSVYGSAYYSSVIFSDDIYEVHATHSFDDSCIERSQAFQDKVERIKQIKQRRLDKLESDVRARKVRELERLKRELGED